MTLRLKIILTALGIVAVLLIVFSVIAVVNYFKKQTGQSAEQKTEQSTPLPNQANNGQNGGTQTNPAPVANIPAPVAKPGDEVISLVVPFVERFGSYSNQGSFENLSDLLPFMSDSMNSWAQKQIIDQKNKPFQTVYHGVTTKALQYTLSKYDTKSGSAEMKVTTQRKELIGASTNARVYNQDIIIKLVKKDTAWVVDGAYWQ